MKILILVFVSIWLTGCDLDPTQITSCAENCKRLGQQMNQVSTQACSCVQSSTREPK